MQRVVEALEYVLDEKETLLKESKVQLERLGREKVGLDFKLGMTQVAYGITNGMVNSFLIGGKSETDPVVMMQRASRKELFDEIGLIVDAQKAIVKVIAEVGELVCDLEIDVDEIRAFVRAHKADEGKVEARKGVNFGMVVVMP